MSGAFGNGTGVAGRFAGPSISTTPLHTPDGSGGAWDSIDGLYREGGHIALIAPTSPVKMQLRRIAPAGSHEFFLSPAAAEARVSAYRR